MPDSNAKTEWEKKNVLRVCVKVNRNQSPELFKLLESTESKSGLARELMQAGIKSIKQETE